MGTDEGTGADVMAFARYLWRLVSVLDPVRGRYAQWAREEPRGIRACLAGADVPPWDVVEALLDEWAAGAPGTGAERERARRLHAAAAAAHDRRPGGREDLLARRRVVERQLTWLALRGRDLVEALHGLPASAPQARRLRPDLDRARAAHRTAGARRAELDARIAALDALAAPGAGSPPPSGSPPRRLLTPGLTAVRADGRDSVAGAAPGPAADPGPVGGPPRPLAREDRFRAAEPEGSGPEGSEPEGSEPAGRTPAGRTPEQSAPRRRAAGGARFGRLGAGEDGDPVPGGPAPVPLPATSGGARFSGAPAASDGGALPGAGTAPDAAAPRGARFGGAPRPSGAPVPAPEDTGAVAATVAALRALRSEGRGGEAHAVLCGASNGPAARLPLLADALRAAGLGADWSGVLWEVAALPPGRLLPAVAALDAAGHHEDAARVLRQGVARPPGEIAATVLGLLRLGLDRPARTLLGAHLRTHGPAGAVPVVRPDPPRLVPALLAAARSVSPGRERDVARALRAAGLPGG